MRALRALCDEGAIRRVGRSRFAVVDAERLRDLARRGRSGDVGEAVRGGAARGQSMRLRRMPTSSMSDRATWSPTMISKPYG